MSELKQGHLPDDFPGRAALAEADINTYAQTRKQRDSEEGLTGVPGIGKATATKIEERLIDDSVVEPEEPVVGPELEAVTDEPVVEPDPFFAPEATKYEYDVANPASLIPMISDAWNESKGKGDAAFNDCAPDFKGTLLQHAIDVLKTSAVLEGDAPIAKFERKIAVIMANK